MHRRPLVLAPLLLLCTARAPAQPSPPQTLVIAADTPVADLLREAGERYARSHPGVTVRVDGGAAGSLLERVAGGAAVDVLASADTDTLQRGIERRLLVAGPPRVFAGNGIVLVVPSGRTAPLARPADLGAPDVLRIAMGRTASVPAGRHAREAIDALRLWPSVQRKIVVADTAAAVLEMVARGDAEAGFAYRTDAQATPGVRIALALDSPVPVQHAAAVVAASRQPALARDFIASLHDEAFRAVLVRRGFLVK